MHMLSIARSIWIKSLMIRTSRYMMVQLSIDRDNPEFSSLVFNDCYKCVKIVFSISLQHKIMPIF